MKLNFWQWLAVVLLVIGLAWWIYDWRNTSNTGTSAAHQPPTTQDVSSK